MRDKREYRCFNGAIGRLKKVIYFLFHSISKKITSGGSLLLIMASRKNATNGTRLQCRLYLDRDVIFPIFGHQFIAMQSYLVNTDQRAHYYFLMSTLAMDSAKA